MAMFDSKHRTIRAWLQEIPCTHHELAAIAGGTADAMRTRLWRLAVRGLVSIERSGTQFYWRWK